MSNSKAVMRTQKRKKLHAIDFFGGKCQICGYNKCVEALEFHHIDSEDKKYSPSYVILHWSWARAKPELEKCLLVCANCHREIHSKEINLDLLRYIVPWVKKTCPTCKSEYDTKNEYQIYCSLECRSIGKRVVNRPSREQLKELIDSKVSWTKMGKMFGVSDNGVRKWAKKYKLI